MNRNAFLALLTLGALTASAQTPADKRAVTIQAFDYSAVVTPIQAIFGTQVNIGVGIQSMMTSRVVRDGRFTVVDRRNTNAILAEQDFNNSNRVKRGSGARTGNVRGADLLLAGDVVVFGRDDRQESKGKGVEVLGVGKVSSSSSSEGKAVVVIDFRLIDQETSEVIATGEARGESQRVSTTKGSTFYAGLFSVGSSTEMTSSNFANTIIGEAVQDAVDKLAVQLKTVNLQGASTGRAADVDARVADVSGNTLIINAGSMVGVAVGQTFTVYHKGKEIKDPTTGEVLDVQTTAVGKLTITSIRDKISTGSYTGGTVPVVGDVVRP
ncbi:MAG: CsgG/HfaB family protein [Acidobacteriota bacterium]